MKPTVNNEKIYISKFSPLINDTVNISFGEDTQSIAINLEEAKYISGIHCPCCGRKMLSLEEFINIINKAEKVKYTPQLINILKEYHEFIPRNYSGILEDIKQIPDYNLITVQKLISKLAKLSYAEKQKSIDEAKEYLTYIAKSHPETKKSEEGLKVIEEISNKDQYSIFKEKINKFMTIMNLTPQERNMVKADLLKNVLCKELYFSNFFIKNTPDMKPEELARIFLAGLFKDSLSEIHNISQIEKFKLNPNNRILLCKTCAEKKTENYFWRNSDEPTLKENLTKYLLDISILMGEGKITSNKWYIKNICSAINKLSKFKIEFKPEEINYISNLTNIFLRHEEFLPIKQTQIDIPCADCGSIMLPNEMRDIIKSELFKCKTPLDYAKIFKKYDKYIGVYSHDLVEKFINLAQDYPELSNDEFVEKYKSKIKKYCKTRTEEAVDILLEGRTYFVNTNQMEKVKFMDEVYDTVYEYCKSGSYSDCKYINMYNACFRRWNNNRQINYFISKMLDKLRIISFQYSMALIPENVQYNVKDDLYAIAFSLFNTNTATVDHLLAKSKGGKKDKNNLIGLCKGCNTIKGNKNVPAWFDQHHSVRVNLPKQMRIIDAMAYRGQIEGYKDWAEEIAQKMYELTEGRFDIRYRFEK